MTATANRPENNYKPRASVAKGLPRKRTLPPGKCSKHLLNKKAIRRLARRGGVERDISAEVRSESYNSLESYILEIVRGAAGYAEQEQRTTIGHSDIHHALRSRGTMQHVNWGGSKNM